MAAASSQPTPEQLLTYLLRLADDNLILSQQLGALIARMPELEEDIAVANLALDHIGQARNLYQYGAEIEASTGAAEPRDEDQFAMLRTEREFLNAVLVEQPNGDFAHTMVRQFFVDAYQVPLYGALSDSADERLAGIAAKAVKEASYHLDHSSGWLVTLGNGTSESHQRTQTAVDELWPFTADLFAADDTEDALIAAGVAADPAAVRPHFDAQVAETMAAANVTMPSDPYQRLGGRTGFHTEHLGHLLPEMQALYRAHPGVRW